EHGALQMAEKNLRASVPEAEWQTLWCDAARPWPKEATHVDWVVMNPPAHDLYDEAPAMVRALFHEAHGALKPSGQLWLVANRHLPYERQLETLFGRVAVVAENGRFKVLEA